MKSYAVGALCAVLALGSAYAQEPPARVPLVPADTQDEILQPAFNAIRARGTEPGNMHRVVGHSPEIFKAYLGLATALRNSAEVPRADRELMILRIAQLANAEYEFTAHRPMALSCGISEAQVDGLAGWKTSKMYSDKQRALLAYAEEIGSPLGVSDATFEALQGFYQPREIVELTMTGAFYNMASQVTGALEVKSDLGKVPSKYGKC